MVYPDRLVDNRSQGDYFPNGRRPGVVLLSRDNVIDVIDRLLNIVEILDGLGLLIEKGLTETGQIGKDDLSLGVLCNIACWIVGVFVRQIHDSAESTRL